MPKNSKICLFDASDVPSINRVLTFYAGRACQSGSIIYA